MAVRLAESLLESSGLDLARSEAALTHRHPLAGDVSAAVVVLCRNLLRGADWEDALDLARRGRRPAAQCALQASSPIDCRPGGFAPDTLEAALAFVGPARSFDEALEPALAFAGAANYCPVLVGAIAGARWGASAIPIGALKGCGLLGRVERAAHGLATDWCGD